MEYLKKKEDFIKVIRRGKRIRLRYLSASISGNDQRRPRVGISVSRKAGKSVVRNRIRRRLREAARIVLREMGAADLGVDILFIPTGEAESAPFEELKLEVAEIIRKSREYKENENRRLDKNSR